MDENVSLENASYQALDPTKRQIRLLKLSPGIGSAPIECRLFVASIPPVVPIADPFMDASEKLAQRQTYVSELLSTHSQKIDKWKQSLQAEYAALLQESQSLKAEVGPGELVPEQSKDLNVRIERLKVRSENFQRSKHDFGQSVKRRDSIAAKFSEPSDQDLSNVVSVAQTEEWNAPSNIGTSESNEIPGLTAHYEAVSYCWNNLACEADIYLDGSRLKAPSSAVEVLENLRLADRSRVLWIDALCINQKNLREREQQVAMMGDIYSRSDRALVWLGPSSDDVETKNAVELCGIVARQILRGQNIHELPDIDIVATTCREVSIPDDYSPRLLNVIFCRRWFTRLWVWQEVALPPVSICQIGPFVVPWQDLILTSFWWNEVVDQYAILAPEKLPDEHAEWNMHFPSTIFMIANEYDQNNPVKGLHLSELVHQSRHGEATDVRDKIFGLLGMTRWSRSGRSLPAGIRPSYAESIRNCMRNATRVMLAEDGDLKALSSELLDVERGPGSEYEMWPSWTPAWSMTDELQGAASLGPWYNADNGRKLSLDKLLNCNDLDVLDLEGCEVDCIASTTFISQDYFTHFETLPSDFQRFHSSIGELSSFPLDVLLLTLLAGECKGEVITRDTPIIEELADHLTSVLDSFKATRNKHESTLHPKESPDQVDRIMSDLRQKGRGRQLFITRQGRLGIGPRSTKEHDDVVVLFGGQWPFVVREQGGRHILVGHSFVQGIMDGEFVREKEAEGIQRRTYKLY